MQHFFTILNSFYLEAPDSKVTREDEKKKIHHTLHEFV